MSEDHYESLSDYEHVRLRVEVQFGSREKLTHDTFVHTGDGFEIKPMTWTPAVYTAFREILDNSLDEITVRGHGDSIWVDIDGDQISIRDNGRGVPIHEIETLGKGPAASILLGQLRSGSNFRDRKDSAGMNGLGSSVVNFTSSEFELEIYRDGKRFFQQWTEGQENGAPVHQTDGPSVKRTTVKTTGTKVTYRLSPGVYPDTSLDMDFVKTRLLEVATINPKVSIYLNGSKLATEGRKPYSSTWFPHKKVTAIPVSSEGVSGELYVTFGEEAFGHVAVNNIPVFYGGTHVDAFLDTIKAKLVEQLSVHLRVAIKDLPKDKPVINRGDITNIQIMGHLKITGAQFDSQNKSRLVSNLPKDITSCVMNTDIKGIIRDNPNFVKELVAKVAARNQKRNDKGLRDEQKKAKVKRPAGLIDATGKHRKDCILVIAEGESAISGVTAARDPKIHGGIGLRGKVKNAHGISQKEALQNDALVTLINSIGLDITKFDRKSLRYGKIYIATDADPDGYSILALLTMFFYQFWPEAFDEKDPLFYHLSTPIIILAKGKERKYIYSEDYESFDQNDYPGWSVIRAKGLARLTDVDWREQLNNPKLRPLYDDGKLKDTLDLIFDQKQSDRRKEWLE